MVTLEAFAEAGESGLSVADLAALLGTVPRIARKVVYQLVENR